MHEKIETKLSDVIIKLIKNLFSEEDELDNFFKFIDSTHDKDEAESIKRDMYKLLS